MDTATTFLRKLDGDGAADAAAGARNDSNLARKPPHGPGRHGRARARAVDPRQLARLTQSHRLKHATRDVQEQGQPQGPEAEARAVVGDAVAWYVTDALAGIFMEALWTCAELETDKFDLFTADFYLVLSPAPTHISSSSSSTRAARPRTSMA